jgi:hypothetical protein
MATGKNPFALSILKQVEHKMHGWDIDSTRWAIKRKVLLQSVFIHIVFFIDLMLFFQGP